MPLTHSLALIDVSAGTHELADLAAAHLPVDDLSAHRGDGIFETVLVTVTGGTHSVKARRLHFDRFRGSARALGLPVPVPEVWDAAVDDVARAVIAGNPGVTEFSVRYTLSRGLDAPRGWVMSISLPEAYPAQRREGADFISLDRGFEAYAGQSAPWLLLGAKTLSYAANMAATRWAQEHGADDGLFISRDGLVLEGPTSNVIIRRGHELLTPDPKAGLLHGTTQQTIFAAAAEHGYLCSYADLTRDDLLTADGAWMVSSARVAVPFRSLDGEAVTMDPELTGQMYDWVTGAPDDATAGDTAAGTDTTAGTTAADGPPQGGTP